MRRKIRFGILFIMTVMFGCITASGQTLADYKYFTGTDANLWRSFSSPTTILATEGDYSASSVQNLGFTFKFGATNYTQFSVNSDGNLRFGSTVTGTDNYRTPFSTDNIAQNSPKINFFGCDGYLPSSANGGYVKYEVLGTSPNRVGVVEFSTNTYSQRSSNYNFKWQVQLYEGTNRILIVYPSTVPSVNPSVACQHGMCTGSGDLILVDASHNMTHYTSGQSSTIASSYWPDASRYYLFDPSVTPMALGVTYSGTLGTIGVWSSYPNCRWTEYGEEHVFSFTPQFSGSYVFDAEQPSGDPDFVLMNSFGNTGTNLISNWSYGVKTVALTAGVTYYLIADNYSTTSSASYTVSVKIAPATIPYTCTFDTDSESGPWTLANTSQTNYWMVGNETSNSSPRSLYITNDGSSNTYDNGTTSYVYAYRTVNFTSTGTYVVSFKWKCNGESNFDLLRAFLIPVSASPTLTGGTSNGQTSNTNTVPSGWIDVANPAGKLNLNNNWQISSQSVDISSTGEYYLVFFWKNDSSIGNNSPAAVDDIEVATPCTATATLSANAGSTSVALTRTSGSGIKYDILVSTSSNPETATESPVAMTSTTQTITGLTPATQYYAYIRSYCSEYRHGAWSSALSFVTTCDKTSTLSASVQGPNSVSLTRTSGNGVKYDILVSTSSNPASATESPVTMTATTQTVSGLTPATQYYAYIRSYCTDNIYGAWSSAVGFVTTCDKTSTLSANVQGPTSVSLTRTSGNGVKYDILVSTSSNPASATESPVTMTATTQTVSGLTPATQYYAYIRSYCTDNLYGVWSSGVSFVTACDKIATLSVDVQGSSLALLTRTSGDGVKYDILVSRSSNPATATESPIEMTSETQTITGLTPATQYYAYIRSYCTASIYGEWSSAVAFVTDGVCSTVSDLTINAGGVAADISWSYTGHVSQYQLFVSPTEMSESDLEGAEIIEVTDPNYTATGLSILTDYYVYVRPICNEYETGLWSSVQFTTLNDVYQLPYHENFENVSSLVWTMDNSDNGWYVGSATANGGNNSLYISSNNGETYEYNTSTTSYSYAYCKLNINEQSVVNVSFDWKCYGESSYDLLRAFMIPVSENPTLSGDNGISSSSNPAGWIDVSQNGGKLNYSSAWSHSSKDLIFTETGIYYLVFFWKNDGSWGSQPPAAVDNISVEVVSTCLPVQNVTVNPGRVRAIISWNEIVPTEQKQVLVSTSSSVSSATETPILVTGNSTTVSNLERNTTYYAFVRADCSESAQSPWSNAVQFTTLDQCTPVENLSVEYSSNSVSLSWESTDIDAELWQVIVTTADDPVSATEEPLLVDSRAATVSDLTPNTQYTAYVRTHCGGYGYSDWESASFKTSPVSVSLPYYVDFEGSFSSNWVFENGSNGWYAGRATSNGGSRSIYISDNMGTSNYYSSGATTSYAYFTFNIEQAGIINVSFDWKCNGESTDDYLRAFIVPALILPSFVAGETNGIGTGGSPSGWIAIDDGKLNLSSSWNNKSKNVTLSSGLYYVVFYWRNDGTLQNQPPAAIDNVSVSVVTNCLYDGNVDVSDIGKTSATISWSDSDDISQWELLVTTASNLDDATETPMLMDVTTITLSDLNPGTDYYVYLRPYCSESSVGLWKDEHFTTLPFCLPVDYVDAEDYGRTWVTVSWENVEEMATQWEVLVTQSDNPYNATETPILVNSTITTIDGLEPNTDYRVYVRAKCSESEYSEWEYDWFTTYPPCVPPYDFSVLVSQTTAKLSWYTRYDRLGTRVVISDTEKTDVELADEEFSYCYSNNKNFNNLTPGQTYHIYAATECEDDVYGDWVHFQFTTPELVAMSLPYTQDFEDGVMANWAINNSSTGWYWGKATAKDSESSLYVSYDRGASNSYYNRNSYYNYSYAYCRLNIDHRSVVRVQFDWKCYGRYDSDCLRAFLVPTSINPSLNAGNPNGMYYYSGYNGPTPNGWINVADPIYMSERYYYGAGSNWQTNTYDLNIATTGDYYLVFFWIDQPMDRHDPPAAIDNISVSYLTDCLFSGSVNVSNVTKTTVDVSWSTIGPATQWQILATEAGSSEEATETPWLVSSSPYTLTGLNMNTSYHTYIRSYCSETDQGIWIRASDFTTLPPCEPPYDISAIVSPYSVDLNWRQTYQYDSFNIYISPTEMTDEQLATVSYGSTTGLSYSRYNLEAGQNYHAYISSNCALGEMSEWADFEFRTTEDYLITLPYYQDYDSGIVENWYINNETNGWYVGSAVAQSGSHSMYVSSDQGMTNSYDSRSETYSSAFCAFNIDGRTAINVSFDWNCYGNSDDYLLVFLVPSSADPYLYGSEILNDSDSWIFSRTLFRYGSEWTHFSENIEIPGEDMYFLVFLWTNQYYYYYYSSYTPAAIDNLAIVPLSKENDILSFTFAGMTDAVIDAENHTVTCTVPYSLNLSSIKPSVTVSEAATISPESNTYIDLNSPFVYVVTSEDGTEQEWTVTATRLSVSSEAEILSFWTDGLLSVDINSDNATVNAVISRMYDITDVSPTFGISNLATINHTNGTAYDFSAPRQFAVTAEDRSVKRWTVNVAYGDSPLGVDCANPYVVDAENDLPYSHSASTADMYNMYNTYNLEYPLYMEGNDAVYRIDLPYMMRLNIEVSSGSEGYGVFVMSSCGNQASYIDYKTDIIGAETLTVDLPAGSFYVVIDTYGEDIDYNIQISRVLYCYAVNDIEVTRLQNELDIAWSSYNVDDNWTLMYGLEGFDIDTEGTQVVVDEPYYVISGLPESTRYDIYVRANCGVLGNSDWTQVTSSTIATCQMPEDLTAVEVYDVDATLSWEGFNMTQWEVQYSKEGESNYTSLFVDEPVVSLTNLQISTEYNVKVRSICDGSYSDFAELNITTYCTIVRDFPFVENFDGEIFPPVCWTQERTAVGSGAGLSYANGAWMSSTSSAGDNTTPKAMLADTKAGSVHNLASLGLLFVESINGYDVSLDVYRSAVSESSSAEGVEVWVNSYPDIVNGTPRMLGYVSKNYLAESAGVVAEEEPGWYTYTFNARGLVGISYVILVGKSNNAGGLFVDNLTVEKAVDCIAPSNFVVESAGEDNLVLAWSDANAVQGTWTVRYSLNGGDVVETSVDEQQLTITGLQAGTVYNISLEVQGICALGMESDWYNATVEATTDCSPVDLPYTQDFEVANGELPDCWRATSDRSNVWSVSGGVAHLAYGNSQVEAHLLSPRFNLTADVHYSLEFDVLQSTQNITRPDSLFVLYVNNYRTDTLRSIAIQNASSNGMTRMSINVPQYVGEARFDFVLSGYRECSIDNILLRPMSSEAEILTFEVPEQTAESVIDSENATISVYVASVSNSMYFTPTFTISENATVDVPSGEWRDFSAPVEYVVTAEDGVTSRTWTVTVSLDENYCPNPSADDIYFYEYGDSADIYIYPANNETSYNLKISSQPIDPETETAELFYGIIEPDSVGYGWRRSVIEGLDAYTYYYIYVQSNCGATGWTEKTACGIFTLPYEQDFSDVDCWEIDDYNNDGRTWSIANGEAMYTFSRTNQADDYLVSPKLQILQNAKLEFKYKAGNFSYPETFLVLVSNGNDTVQLDSLTVSNETYQTYGPVDLSDFAGQLVDIEIQCKSEANRYRLYIDDFKVLVSDYVINVSSEGNGTISPNGIVEVAPGESTEFAILPDEYNDLLSLTLDGEDVSDEVVDGIYTLADVNAEHTLIATFTERYTFTASAGEGGHIVTDGVTVAEHGDTVSFVVIPDEGYRPGDVIVDGIAEQLEQGSYIYTFENVEASHTIHATFNQIIYHTVHVVAGDNGLVSPSGDVVVEEGENLTISVIPYDDFIIHEFLVDGVDAVEELIAHGYNYYFENITADHNVQVSFVENVYYPIAVSYGEHGIITPNGDVSVANGADQIFHIVADAGYHIESVTVDGENVPTAVADGEYTFVNVTAEHTIHAEFAINTYTIVAYAQGGTITPSGTITVNHGDNLTLEFEPEAEYELLNFLVDNVSQQVDGNTFTFDSITADHAVVAIFIPMNIIRHEITATAGVHGSISPSGRVRVVDGESQTFQIIPDEHYYISSLLVEGEAVDVADSYQFQNVTADHTISASFEVYKHVVTAIAGEHGSVSPSGEQEVDEGSDITFTFAPSVGYIVSEVLVDDVSVEFSGNTYTLRNVLEGHVVRVNFDLLPMWSITAVSGANGTISPNGTQYVLNGDDIEFAFVPNDGYMLDRVVVDGHGIDVEGNTYRFENVSENHYIYVSFRPLVYFITAEAGPHGQLSPSGIVEVEPGATQVFTFNPYIGYELDSVFVDGEYIITDGNTYEFADVNANHTFRVTFKHIAVDVADETSMTASLYPNPNDGRFLVDFAGINGNVVYQLVNAAGVIIEERDIYVDEGMTMEFYHELRPGVYFARFVSGDKVLVERFVVK